MLEINAAIKAQVAYQADSDAIPVARVNGVTTAAVIRARCQVSWWSTSATDAPNRFRSCSLAERTNVRFSFRECDSGKWSSAERIPTQPEGTAAV